jgi:hypothetical protein
MRVARVAGAPGGQLRRPSCAHRLVGDYTRRLHRRAHLANSMPQSRFLSRACLCHGPQGRVAVSIHNYPIVARQLLPIFEA